MYHHTRSLQMACLTFAFLLQRNISDHIKTDLKYCAVCLTSDDNDNDDGDDYNDVDVVDAVDAAADHTDDVLQQRTCYRITWGVSLILSRYLHQGREGISSRVKGPRLKVTRVFHFLVGSHGVFSFSNVLVEL